MGKHPETLFYPLDLTGEVFYCTKPLDKFLKNFETDSAAGPE